MTKLDATRRNTFEMPRAGEVWVHYKGGRYVVTHVGTDAETGSPQVGYYPLSQDETYRRSGPDAVDFTHRRLDVFLGWTKNDDGNVRRFAKVADGAEEAGE